MVCLEGETVWLQLKSTKKTNAEKNNSEKTKLVLQLRHRLWLTTSVIDTDMNFVKRTYTHIN